MQCIQQVRRKELYAFYKIFNFNNGVEIMHSQPDELLSVEGAFFSPDEKNRLVD